MPDDSTLSARLLRAPTASRSRPRSFLFLQGPLSDFFDQLGRALLARGHQVHRINLHLGERLFWRLPATDYRGRLDDWRPFIAAFLDRHAITDLVFLGDRRPYHLIAAEEARARGIAVACTELGYLRPDWLTLEPDGMTTYSRFPRDPDAVRQLAEQFPEPELEQQFHTPFRLIATLDVIYNLAELLGWPLYPFYRRHAIFHPLLEYVGWLSSWSGRQWRKQRTYDAKIALQSNPRSYFLFPLQLATDYQIRAHSPYSDARDAVREVIRSYARSGVPQKLAIVIHPLDNGLIAWRRLVAETARLCRISEQVEVIDGGIPTDVIRASAGTVTINSTVGLTALRYGVPVKVLGNAVFDIPGLTHQEALDTFWAQPTPPDPEFTATFLRALAGATQLKGGYYTRESQVPALSVFTERLEASAELLQPAKLADNPIRPSTSTVVVTAIPGGLGLAVARAFAAPGTTLHLVGFIGRERAAAIEDCRWRGAIVHSAPGNQASAVAVAHSLDELDRNATIDVLVTDRGSTAVNAIAAGMRRRGRGQIALVEPAERGRVLRLVSDAAPAEIAVRDYARELQRQVSGADVTVSLVRPGRLAAWLSDRCGAPGLVAVTPDRAASLIRRGLDRTRPVIAFPGPLSATARAFRVLPQTVRQRLSGRLLPHVVQGVPATEDEGLRETGTGD